MNQEIMCCNTVCLQDHPCVPRLGIKRDQGEGQAVLAVETARSNLHAAVMAEESGTEVVKSAGPSSPIRSPHGVGPVATAAGAPGGGGGGGKAAGSSPHSPRHQTRRVRLSEQQLDSLSRDELAAKWREQDLYVECLETQTAAALEGTEMMISQLTGHRALRVTLRFRHILSERPVKPETPGCPGRRITPPQVLKVRVWRLIRNLCPMLRSIYFNWLGFRGCYLYGSFAMRRFSMVMCCVQNNHLCYDP